MHPAALPCWMHESPSHRSRREADSQNGVCKAMEGLWTRNRIFASSTRARLWELETPFRKFPCLPPAVSGKLCKANVSTGNARAYARRLYMVWRDSSLAHLFVLNMPGFLPRNVWVILKQMPPVSLPDVRTYLHAYTQESSSSTSCH